MKEHNLEMDHHLFNLGDRKIKVDVPTIKQVRDYAAKAKEADESESFNLLEEYFKGLGVSADEFNSLTVPQMQVMLEVINTVPK